MPAFSRGCSPGCGAVAGPGPGPAVSRGSFASAEREDGWWLVQGKALRSTGGTTCSLTQGT